TQSRHEIRGQTACAPGLGPRSIFPPCHSSVFAPCPPCPPWLKTLLFPAAGPRTSGGVCSSGECPRGGPAMSDDLAARYYLEPAVAFARARLPDPPRPTPPELVRLALE